MSKSTKTAAAAPKSATKTTNAKAAAPAKKTAAPAAKKSAPKASKSAAATAQQVISGTTPELIAGVLLNGVPLEGPYLSMMLKFGIVHKVGEVKSNPGGRGKAANIIELRSTEGLKFTRAASASLA